MKYKVGDKVQIKSLNWYNENKNDTGYVHLRIIFTPKMSKYCGQVTTIIGVINNDIYKIALDNSYYDWTDEMFEGLMEEENKKNDTTCMYDDKLVAERFSDKITIKGLKYNKLSINTELCEDKVELVISPEFELKQEDGKWFVIKKKKEYPKTYEECCKVLSLGEDDRLYTKGYKASLIQDFQKLLICRDTYWKIAGEEMGLGKPWKPDWNHLSDKWVLFYTSNRVGLQVAQTRHSVFAFPTEEMRDAFYENFKELIESCKELL